ncbi:AAA family ATPase [Corynebacterium glutamicum]|uniref:AAA family ATPase n=1 Tax=Corynebacterium glutamicum TaxID=1718 RepID=UPI0035B682D4
MDEPELNLHPQNQVLMGRLLAALSHAGLKILATTPSDYIVRELSILVILSQKTSQHCLLVTLQSMF